MHVNAIPKADIDFSKPSNFEDYMFKWVMNYLILRAEVLLEITIVCI